MLSIPGGPLAPARERFADQSGPQRVYGISVTHAAGTVGLRLRDREAGASAGARASRLVRNADQQSTGSDGVRLAQATDSEGNGRRPDAIELQPIDVEGQRETPYGPVEGYVAGRSARATKTDTPLIEILQSISVITRDQLEAQGVQRFDEALRYTAGVATESFGFDIRQASIQLRGFFATNQNIYRDGLQLRNPGFAAFLTPEPYGAERIEVFRGPASVLYGQGGPGGLVNYVTKRPTQ